MWELPLTPATSLSWWEKALGGVGVLLVTAFGVKVSGKTSDSITDGDKQKFEERINKLEMRQNTQGETLTTHTTILSRLDSMASDIRSARDCTIKIAAHLGIEGPK